MKNLSHSIFTFLICLIFVGCQNKDENRYELKQFRGLKPPIIVVSKGTVDRDTRIIAIDSLGVLVGFNDNGFTSSVKGDTLVYAKKKIDR